MRTLILCGGRGTRAYPHTLEVPKPLLCVAGQPILARVMEIYANQGFTEFVLAAGFKATLVREFARDLPAAWDVTVIDTGEHANTGERVRACLPLVGTQFFLTYGDGLANVDLRALRAFHDAHGGAATLTAVPLPSPYGTIAQDGKGRVHRFVEKPRLDDHWINAGFFLFEQRVVRWTDHPDLERGVLPALAGAGELYAYPHGGFWRSMDTYKDAIELSALCSDGAPPPWSVSEGMLVR